MCLWLWAIIFISHLFLLGGILVFALGCQSRRVSAVGTGCFLPYCLFCFMALSEKGKDGMQADDMGVGNYISGV